MQDEEIMKLLEARDQRALKELASLYGRQLENISYGITNDRRDAAECVNDAYLSVWNSIPPAKPENLKAYVYETVRNISHQRFRYNTAKKRSAPTVSLDDELSQIVSGEQTDTDGLADAINGFLSRLDSRSRMLFIRRYYYNDSAKQLTELTGLTENALNVKLFRIRKKLAEYLKKEGFTL